MKKAGVVLGLFLVLSIFMINFVSAGVGDDVRDALDKFAEGANPVLGFVLGDVDSGELLFVKLLLTIVIIAVALFALKRVPNFGDKKGLVWIIAIVVGLLGARFLAVDALINFIWTPYGILGILLATLLPFVIFFYFIESFNSSIIRKVGWSSFAVVYFVLALIRWDDLAWSSERVIETGFVGLLNNVFNLGLTATTSEWWQNLGWVYILVALLSVIAILADRQIRTRYFASMLTKDLNEGSRRQAQSLLAEINKLNSRLEHATTDKQRDSIKSQVRDKREALGRLSDEMV